MIAWNALSSEQEFEALLAESYKKPQYLFKHSTRCGISHHAKAKLEGGTKQLQELGSFHYLDLLTFRSVSNYIAEVLNVRHQSPQIIVVKNGEAIYSATHQAIDVNRILKHIPKQ